MTNLREMMETVKDKSVDITIYEDAIDNAHMIASGMNSDKVLKHFCINTLYSYVKEINIGCCGDLQIVIEVKEGAVE